MGFELRPYQQDCLDTIVGAIPDHQHILVQAATGAGKTIVFCALIQQLLSKWPYIRIGILAHRRELIGQARDKLLITWPDAPIGIACASTGEAVDTDQPVVIGSIQTLVRRLESTAAFDVIIVDEAHRIPPLNLRSMYSNWIEKMQQANPAVRVLGFTATPFRLGHGYIYGAEKKPENRNLFPALNYRIGIEDLQPLGFLCPYRAKTIANSVSADLATVSVKGDYNIAELSDVMGRQEHVGSAVHALKEHAADRKRIVVFAVTIAHATKLMVAFTAAGYRAATVHSKMPLAQRDMILRGFEQGMVQVMTSVGVLTEGWDSPAVDCLVLCRPTKSTGLYVQMVGRGLRPHPDKTDVLILDLSNNCLTHGDPAKPTVTIPGAPPADAVPVLKACPKCEELVRTGIMVCPACGYEWPPPEVIVNNDPVVLRDVSWSAPEPITATIERADFYPYTSRAGNFMMRLEMRCRVNGHVGTNFVNEYFDFDGNNAYGHSKALRLWRMLVQTDPPQSVAEAGERRGELLMSLPEQVMIVQKEKFWNVQRWTIPMQDRRN